MERKRKGKGENDDMRFIGWLILMLFVLILLTQLTGCKQIEYVPTVEYHTDTLIKTKEVRDSVYLHDSTYIHDRGDTVLVEKWHTRWRDRTVTDTLYIHKTDSVPKPYPVIKEVPAELTWWQRMRIGAGNVLFVGLFVAALFGAWKLYKKIKP